MYVMSYLWKPNSFLKSWPSSLQVDSLEKLEAVFSGTSNTDMLDCSCVLVTAPEKTDHTYNDLMDVTDGPVIEMPVWSQGPNDPLLSPGSIL